MTLGDVRRYRHCCTANLGNEAEPLICRQSTPYFVRLEDESDAELPDMQISITTNHEELEK